MACEYLISAKVIRPGPVTVVKRVAHAREVARRETFDRLAREFTDERRAGLDGLLVVDAAIGMPRPRWLGKGPVEASPATHLCRDRVERDQRRSGFRNTHCAGSGLGGRPGCQPSPAAPGGQQVRR